MTKPNAIVFIVANENFNAGERDYTKALVTQIQEQGLRADTDYLFYKIAPKDAALAEAALAAGGDPRILPATNDYYAAVPTFSAAAVEELKSADSVKIIAAGHTTLATAIELAEQLPLNKEIGYITHLVDDHAHVQTIADCDVRLFATTTLDKLVEISGVLAHAIDFTPLDAVPHTNANLADCEKDYAGFLQSPHGEKVREIVESRAGFAFVVINAGFEVGADRIYHPYTEKEAAEHGYFLGKMSRAGTNLIAVHGGPRNLRDEAPSAEKGDIHTGQKTIAAFTQAYEAAQREQGAESLIIVSERFAPGLPYNAIKAGYVLGRTWNCTDFISNSEGYGTMDGAILHISNQAKLLGMFPFESQYLDPTGQRQANIEKYNKWGVFIMESDGYSNYRFTRHPEHETTPNRRHDGAAVILKALELAQPQNSDNGPAVPVQAGRGLRPDGMTP